MSLSTTMMGFVQGESVWAFCPDGFFAHECSGQWSQVVMERSTTIPVRFPCYKILPRGWFEREVGMPQGKKLMKAWFLQRAMCADGLGTKFTSCLGKRANPSPEMTDWSENRLNRGLILKPWHPVKTILPIWGSLTRSGYFSCRCLSLSLFARPC